MGAKGSIHGIINLKNAEVPTKDVIYMGNMQNILDFLDISRTSIAAQSLGICRRCYLLAVEYAKKRKTFGRSISSRQAIRSMIAEMAIYLYALENCIADTAHKIDKGLGIRREAASCKRLAIETIRRVTDNALLIFGGRGYWSDLPIEMLYRDARAMWFEEGTQHIQEMVVSREVIDNPQWW
jgi:alkylation response protein AidB-like acyl-CoA dehydrogenase